MKRIYYSCVIIDANFQKQFYFQSIIAGDIINKFYDHPKIQIDTQKEVIFQCSYFKRDFLELNFVIVIIQFQIRNFNIQMIQKPLRFTACGFVDIDFTLVRGVN